MKEEYLQGNATHAKSLDTVLFMGKAERMALWWINDSAPRHQTAEAARYQIRKQQLAQ